MPAQICIFETIPYDPLIQYADFESSNSAFFLSSFHKTQFVCWDHRHLFLEEYAFFKEKHFIQPIYVILL